MGSCLLLRRPATEPGLSVFGSNKRLTGPYGLRALWDSFGLKASRRKSGSFSLLTKGPPDEVLVRRLLATRWLAASRKVPWGSDSATAPRFNGMMGDEADDLPAGAAWLPVPCSGLSWRSLMSSISFLVSVVGPGADDGRRANGDASSSPTFGRVESLSLDDRLALASSVSAVAFRGLWCLRVIQRSARAGSHHALFSSGLWLA